MQKVPVHQNKTLHVGLHVLSWPRPSLHRAIWLLTQDARLQLCNLTCLGQALQIAKREVSSLQSTSATRSSAYAWWIQVPCERSPAYKILQGHEVFVFLGLAWCRCRYRNVLKGGARNTKRQEVQIHQPCWYTWCPRYLYSCCGFYNKSRAHSPTSMAKRCLTGKPKLNPSIAWCIQAIENPQDPR